MSTDKKGRASRPRKYVATPVLTLFQERLRAGDGDGGLSGYDPRLDAYISEMLQRGQRLIDRLPEGAENTTTLSRLLEYADQNSYRLALSLRQATVFTEDNIPKDYDPPFEVMPVDVVDLVIAYFRALLNEAGAAGQAEADRLAAGHSNRSRSRDENRESLLTWVHERRTKGTETWKETLAAVRAECEGRKCECPWQELKRLQQDFSKWRGDNGLGRGRRGRPPKPA